MGYWKDWQQAQEDQGWTYSTETVCHRCVTDEHLKEVVRATSGSSPCSFCERAGRRPRKGAPFDALMKVVSSTIRQYYCHALSELPWDSEVGDYWGGENCDTADLINDHFYEISDVDEVRQGIIDRLGDDQWCRVNPFGYSGAERYRVSWGQFCATVKHETRFFFNSVNADDREGSDRELTPIPEVLAEVSSLIGGLAKELVIDTGTRVCRVRRHLAHEVCVDWRALGSPPLDRAPNNRMSAAGMSVFYGAFDMATATFEVAAGLKPREKAAMTGAEWVTTKPVTVVDLSDLPPLPSVFAQPREARDSLVFLREFVKEIMQPVIHDGKEHIDYVPTQILTEYLRLMYQSASGGRIDGLIYPSAQRAGGRSIVIFASQYDLDPDRLFRDDRPILELDDKSIRPLSRPRRRKS